MQQRRKGERGGKAKGGDGHSKEAGRGNRSRKDEAEEGEQDPDVEQGKRNHAKDGKQHQHSQGHSGKSTGGPNASRNGRQGTNSRQGQKAASASEDSAEEDEISLGDEIHVTDDGEREITLAVTRSGAVNELSSRFLRDSDEAVQKRKLLSTLPFEKREIMPRIYKHLSFPVRQDWSHVKTPEELDKLETEYFKRWLDETYSGRSIDHVSPFEHNLEVWRQLWRVIEKSDIIVLTADIRDPLLHIPVALHKHVTEVHKLPVLIVLTKCDLVSDDHVAKWKRFLSQAFDSSTTKIISNSGKCLSTHGIGGYSARRKILRARATKAQIAEMHRQSKQVLDVAMEFAKSKNPSLTQVLIGIVGQPNTGKSSLVNAILGRHAVSVSRTCGHTKHWQTQLIKNENDEIIATLIDSPGLIFPMVVDEASQDGSVSPRAWFECAGLYPIAQIRETFSAVRFAGERVDLPRMYNLKLNTDDYGEQWTPYSLLGSLADKRGYTLQRGGGAPDMHRAGLSVIYDICDGIILICFPAPSLDEWREKTTLE